MLDPKILDFAKQLIRPEIEKHFKLFHKKISQKGRELQLSGNSPETSSTGRKIFCDILNQEIEDVASVIWSNLQRSHEALGSQLTDTLAVDLEEATAILLNASTEGLFEQVCFANESMTTSFYSAINDATQKINTEIDLYVVSLAAKPKMVHSIFGDIWTLLGIPINIKFLRTKLRRSPLLLGCLLGCIFIAIIIMSSPLEWLFPVSEKKGHNQSVSTSLSSEANTRGDSSPSITTSGPNSPVTVNYELPESKTEQITENKLNFSLKAICEDIDSRPLAQQAEAEKQYLGMKIKRECLKVLEINSLDEDRYNLTLTLPDRPNLPSSKWMILCDVSKDKYPELRVAKGGVVFYLNGEIKEMFRIRLVPHITLSDVTLEFE